MIDSKCPECDTPTRFFVFDENRACPCGCVFSVRFNPKKEILQRVIDVDATVKRMQVQSPFILKPGRKKDDNKKPD